MSTPSMPSACGCTRRTSGRHDSPAGELVIELLKNAALPSAATNSRRHFLLTEWEQLVDAWQLETWEAYRDVARLGSKTRLTEAQRAVLWSIFERCVPG